MAPSQSPMSAPAASPLPSSSREQLHLAIGVWMRELEAYPGWKAWRKAKFALTLYDDGIPSAVHASHPSEFVFSPEIDRQHDLIMQYFGIEQAVFALRDCEYYFRRFPFRGLPVHKHTHLTYMCEMFFNRFYELKERLKRYLNALAKLAPKHRIEIGPFLKTFEKEFDQELRERNGVHHHGRFEDLAIDRIFISHTVAERHDGWARESERYYRQAVREWTARARRRSAKAEQFVEAAAQVTLDVCGFLKPPTSEAPSTDATRTG